MRFGSIFITSGAVLAASLFFGGGTQRGVASDLVPQLLALLLIVMAAPAAWPALRANRLLMACLACLLLLPLLHLIPMPPSVWTGLPGRAQFLDVYSAAGVDPPWMPLALRSGEAMRSSFALLPGIALFLGALALDGRARERLVLVSLAIALLAGCLAVLQVIGGSESSLYFHAVTNVGRGVGFFANANHAAALFYVCTPFAAALLVRRTQVSGAPLWLFGAGVMVMFILALALSGSRTALLLGAAALAASAVWIARDTLAALMNERGAGWAAAAAVLLVAPAAMGMGLLTILERFDADALTDTRWPIYKHALEVTQSYWPVGAGLGSFVRAFQWNEPVAVLSAQFVNQAHNDWLQIVLEMGVLAVAAGGLFIVWLVRAFMTSGEGDESTQRLRKAALLAILLLATHSLWDYPLRTIALSAMFGLACALTCAPAPQAPGARRERRSRRRAR